MEMTEKQIQNHLQREIHRAHSRIVSIPNSGTKWSSCDLISITTSLFYHEYEIKISRADYQREFRSKRWKHRVLLDLGRKIPKPLHSRPPNYFWFVTPPNLLQGIRIPEYAGLIEIDRFSWRILQKAPRLHRGKLELPELITLMGNLDWKYWQLRRMIT